MAYFGVYLFSLFAFLAIDAVWLTYVMRPLFERHVGELLRENILVAPAVGFYLIYIVGIIYFCVMPGLRDNSVGLAAFNGLVLGFLAYGTYEFTNMTTLKGWSWSMVIADTGWGMILTAATAAIGYWAGRWMGLILG